MDIPAPLKNLQRRLIIKGQSALATPSPRMTGEVVMWPRVCPSTSWQLRRSGSKRFLNTMTVSKTIIFLHWNLIPLNKTRRLQLQPPHPSLDGSAMKVSNPLPSFFAVPRLQLWTSKMGCWGKGRRFNRASKAPKVICGEPMACLSQPPGAGKKNGKGWHQERGWWFDGVDKSIYEHCLVDNFVILGWHVSTSPRISVWTPLIHRSFLHLSHEIAAFGLPLFVGSGEVSYPQQVGRLSLNLTCLFIWWPSFNVVLGESPSKTGLRNTLSHHCLGGERGMHSAEEGFPKLVEESTRKRLQAGCRTPWSLITPSLKLTYHSLMDGNGETNIFYVCKYAIPKQNHSSNHPFSGVSTRC